MICGNCKRYYTPTRAEAEAIVEARVTLDNLELFERQGGELTPAMRKRAKRLRRIFLCPGCHFERVFVFILKFALATLLLGGVFLSLGGCCRPGTYGPGPASDGEQQELERIRRERGAAKIEQREAERNLQRMIGSR